MEGYSEKVMDHFKNPRNVGEVEDPSCRGKVGNPVCGDIMEITMKIDESEKIVDIKFRTFGCGAAIATSSILTELVKGMTIEEAKNVSNEAVVEALGGLPKVKMHCSVLAEEALHKAIADYYENKAQVK